MTRIAIDSWALESRFRYQGTYVYAQQVVAGFQRLVAQRSDVEISLFTAPRAGNDADTFRSSTGFKIAPAQALANERWWRLFGAARAASTVHADVLFAPTVSSLPLGGVPMVSTIHDVTPLVMPSHSTGLTVMLRSFMRWVAKYSRAIITDSHCSRNDLVRLYGLPESKVAVIYLGYNKAAFNDLAADIQEQKKLLARLGINDRPYIVHHGTIQPRKNLARLIQAYRLMLSRNRSLDLDLVLVGNRGWRYEETLEAANAQAGERGRVLFPGILQDPELALLIKGAALAVIPSLYEGFCLPMVECMACGTPTVVAGTSCLPEVSGNALLYFDPTSIEDMAGQMERALTDTELARGLRTRGLARAGAFEWARCAEQTLSLLVNVAK